MKLPLLERDAALAALARAAGGAVHGRGSVALVHGEAGIGKTSLVAALRDRLPDGVRMLVGCCDDLTTPRVLGPFRDLVGSVGAALTHALRGEVDLDELLLELRTELGAAGGATVLVVEDVHWADDATLDVLRYLSRRIGDMPVLLLLTFRDEELTPEHPVRLLLGHLASTVDAGRLHRLPLEPLSPRAVRALSRCGDDGAEQLHAVTAGNPFFLGELLAERGGDGGLPPTVVDAVLARVSKLPPAVRRCLEALSVIPAGAERGLAEALLGDGMRSLAVAEERGLLTVTSRRISFRHEVSRRAIADTLPVTRSAELNRRVLTTLSEAEEADLSRLVHHAVLAGDRAAVARYGPRAAREAARLGAHREAAAFYRSVLEDGARFEPAERATLLEEYARECHTVGDGPTAVTAQRLAVELHRTLADKPALGTGLHKLSSMYWWTGWRAEAEQAAEEAVATLEGSGEPSQLVRAHNHRTQLLVLADHHAEAAASAERAVALARNLDAPDLLAHALSSLGCARWALGRRAEGRALLEESLRYAESVGETGPICEVRLLLAWRLLDDLRPREALALMDEAAALAEASEHLAMLGHIELTRATAHFALGAWDEAMATVASDRFGDIPQTHGGFLAVQGWIRVRRGEEDGEELLRRALALAEPTGEWQRIGPLVIALTEAAWLRGDDAAARARATAAYEHVRRTGCRLPLATLTYWLARTGGSAGTGPAHDPDHPYVLQATGRGQEAAALWKEAGLVYEYASALVDGDRPEDLLTALPLLDELGARPLARRVRARLRAHGVTRVPRGPAPATRGNPAGLTRRQAEVARLLGRGLTNAQIADRLVLSVRTVDNHVAAVLDKLGLRTRRDVRRRVEELNLPADGPGRAPGPAG
ncbi:MULTISPECIES: ATP-binding protein [unclassified Streptomyces]|uniref:ATP-binding protein n=1 Tax=unclassified Streptomyces TaxID=2593676 RepID=UPI000F70A07E|nr:MULTISPECIES: LuxR family transcriptional regulator [unclassified Streptomyces]AZM59428.1 LuxR family transcriptional regulator [Streptomyces sp. WAC 01438]RSM94065.1 LuxR family transcriptional regulator [Streptomyces sp. WAC 01420]